MKNTPNSLIVCGWLFASAIVHSQEIDSNTPIFDDSSARCAYYSAHLALTYNKLSTKSFTDNDLPKSDGLVSMETLVSCLNAHGLKAVPVKCDFDDLKGYPKGFILVLQAPDQKLKTAFHFCFAFYKSGQDQFYLADPAMSRTVIQIKPDELDKYWTRYAIVLSDRSS